MNHKKFGEDEGEVIDLRKEEEENFWEFRDLNSEMGYIHGSGQINHSIRPNPLKTHINKKKIAT